MQRYGEIGAFRESLHIVLCIVIEPQENITSTGFCIYVYFIFNKVEKVESLLHLDGQYDIDVAETRPYALHIGRICLYSLLESVGGAPEVEIRQ